MLDNVPSLHHECLPIDARLKNGYPKIEFDAPMSTMELVSRFVDQVDACTFDGVDSALYQALLVEVYLHICVCLGFGECEFDDLIF
jgi:hypothetical protein